MTLSNIKALSSQFWFFGLLVGLVGASLITSVITIWELIENPGGIFHNEQGLNWSFVFDTASSWFMPSFLYLAVIAALAHLSITAITKGFTK
ncbi:hypothetical protein [Shewanella sp. UCD-KL12]|uniref:hypothetical protein n=1 Tax=Shewanella sp. UCD-KL12 TaxID=1917163 RepID=UPI0009707EA4|nr:hypothetical protein [Shewanella sp. UCD-KL12]